MRKIILLIIIAVIAGGAAIPSVYRRFIRLLDTPSTYTGQGGKVVKVNSGGTALEFGLVDDLSISGQAEGDMLKFDGVGWKRVPKGSAGQVLEMNALETGPEWGTDDSGSLTAYDDIQDPDAASSITFGDEEKIVYNTEQDTAGTFFLIDDTDSAVGNNVYLLELQHSDDGEVNADFFKCVDNDADVKFSIQEEGNTTIIGTLDVGGTATLATVDTGQGATEVYAMDQDIQTTDAVTFATVDTGQGAGELYAMDQDVQTTDAVTFSTVNTGQGAYELYKMNQDVESTDAVTFVTVDTGLGAHELYAMDQDIQTTDSPTFDTVNTGQGAYELYKMDQDVETTDAVVFATVDTGQGAYELYAMNQDVQSTDSPTFATLNVTVGIDAVGAVDMDYGSADVTDHTFTTNDCTFIVDGGITISTGDNLVLGATQWNSGDSIDGEQIANDTIDDDSIDFTDVTAADITFAEGDITDSTIISADIKNDTIDSADYAAGSIDHEHLADDVISGAAAVGTFESGDTFLVLEAGVGLREADYDDLPAGGSATAWDDIGNPDADDTIALAGYEVGLSSTLDEADHVAFKIDHTDADVTNDTTLFQIQSVDNDDTSITYMKVIDDSGGNADELIALKPHGRIHANSHSDYPTVAPAYILHRARDGDPTSDVSNGDTLGHLEFNGYHTDGYDYACGINAYVDNTPGNGDMPARLEFYTSDDGSASGTKRMTIDSEGDIELGADDNKVDLTIHDAGVLTLYDDSDDTSVTMAVSNGTDNLAFTGDLDVSGAITEGGNAVWNSGETDILDSGHYVAGSIDEEHLNIANAAVDEYALTYEADTSNFQWVEMGAIDTTTVDATTWSDGANASNIWTFDVSGTDHTMTIGNGLITFSHAVTVTGALTGTLTGNADTVTNGVYTTDNLSVLAATTSAQLYGVLSDETGSGAGSPLAVFNQAPTIDSPTFTTAITATDLIDSPHYAADSIDNEHVNWADIDYLTDEGAGINEAYAAGWNADVGPPEKDDIYDYLHSIDSDDDGSLIDEAWFDLDNIAGTDEAGLYSLLSDVSDFTQPAEVPGMTSTTPELIFAFNIHDIDDGMDDIAVPYPRAMTITKVTAMCIGGTNVVGRLYEVDGDGDDSDAVGIEASDWTFTTTETEDSSFNNATLDAGDYLQWDTTSVSGSVTNFRIAVYGYET